eukprot:scaffold100291_cov61-Phaeocystis_antarctica.AAC.2
MRGTQRRYTVAAQSRRLDSRATARQWGEVQAGWKGPDGKFLFRKTKTCYTNRLHASMEPTAPAQGVAQHLAAPRARSARPAEATPLPFHRARASVATRARRW